MDKFFHSVYLKEELCKGCINCIKRCPTQAIRVRNGKASITNKFCIDCGECVRICSYHAKKIRRDKLEVLNNYEYTVALPAPSLYAQFNNLEDINIVLTALIHLGFDDVYEVGGAAELVSATSRDYIAGHQENWPFISTACPTVVRLIRVRFPNLIEHLLPINPPVEVAARLALKKAMEQTGLKREQIGIIFISPCPSKITYTKSPLGTESSEIDHVLAIKDVYTAILPFMNKAAENPIDLAIAGKIGVSWGSSGGEAAGLITDSYLAADGIENVIRVLEDLEDEKLSNIQFIELNSCNGGCVGGILTVENPYAAKVKLKKLRKYLPVTLSRPTAETMDEALMAWTNPVEYEPVYRLGNTMRESIQLMNQVEELCAKFPALDCGTCGAPTCKALAEDIVRGNAHETSCIHILKNRIHQLKDNAITLSANVETEEQENLTPTHATAYAEQLKQYIYQLSSDLTLLDATLSSGNQQTDNE